MTGTTTALRVLVVEDDPVFGPALCAALRDAGLTVFGPLVVPAALDLIGSTQLESPFDGAVVDVRVAGCSGLDVVSALKSAQPTCRIVVLTGFGSIDSVVDAMRRGAHDYLQKPANDAEVLAALRGERRTRAPEMPSLDRVEREHIERALGYTEGNVSRAARLLGMHRRSLQRKLNKD
jgi:two-component system response regulator RegA